MPAVKAIVLISDELAKVKIEPRHTEIAPKHASAIETIIRKINWPADRNAPSADELISALEREAKGGSRISTVAVGLVLSAWDKVLNREQVVLADANLVPFKTGASEYGPSEKDDMPSKSEWPWHWAAPGQLALGRIGIAPVFGNAAVDVKVYVRHWERARRGRG